MTSTEFVESLKLAVEESSIQTVFENYLDAPTLPEYVASESEVSEWFKGLPELEKKMTKFLIQEAVKSSIFSMLCVLDGVRAIENSTDKGKLLLIHRNSNGEEVLLNDINNDEFLHDIYNS
jgi:hypothetical protein